LFFSGCIILNFVSSWLVLFAAINFYTLSFITIFLVVYLTLFRRQAVIEIFIGKKKIKEPFTSGEFLYTGFSLLLFILLGSLKPVNNDTQIYHLQIIKWLSQYGAVPGVANLSPRLGLGSGWFNLISLLGIPLFKNQNYSFLNTSFVCWTFLWLLDKFKFYRKDKSSHAAILSLFYFTLFIYFMFDWQLFRDAANSTNYDFPVTAFMIIAISFLIEEIIKNKPVSTPSYIFLLFAFTIISFKFSGIFIVLLVSYYLLQNIKPVYFSYSLIIGLLILFPVFIKNYIITGYPLYPLPLNIDKPDWQLPVQLTEGIYRYILNSNRFYNAPFTAEPMGNSPFYWGPIWFSGILIQHKIIFIASIISIFALSFVKPIAGIDYRRLKYLMAALSLMLAGWFFTAPDPGRFGYGILLPVSLLCISIFLFRFVKPFFYNIILACLSLVLIYYTYQKGNFLIKEPRYLLVTVKGDQPPYKTKYINGVGINMPEIINNNWNRRCYDIDLPCSCEENPYLQPRGKSIKEGFRMYPQPDSSFAKNYIY
jgi:hypothetical protein